MTADERTRAAVCEHESFAARVNVSRITDSAVWYADLTVTCAACGQAMQFIGFPVGLSPAEPMVDVTGTEARLPFRPFSEEETKRRLLGEHPGFRLLPAEVEEGG